MTTPTYDVTTNATSTADNLDVVSFIGSAGAILCYFCLIVTMVGMGMRGIRTHIHCNISTFLLLYHVLLLVGGIQEQGSNTCKAAAMLTQLTCLIAFCWILIEVIYLFQLSVSKKREINGAKNGEESENSNHAIENNNNNIENIVDKTLQEADDEDSLHEQNIEKDDEIAIETKKKKICTKLIIYYVIAWIGPTVYAAATFPAVVSGYGEAKNCWVATHANVIWVYGAPIPAIFIFHCLLSYRALKNFKGRIEYANMRHFHRRSAQSSVKTRTSILSASTYEKRIEYTRENSSSSSASKSDSDFLSQAGVAQSNLQRRELIRTTAHRGYHGNPRHSEMSYYDDRQRRIGGNNVIVYPPVNEIQQTRMTMGISSKEIEGPLSGFVTTLYWQAGLCPTVTLVWVFGFLSVNFEITALKWTFCLLNIIQALYIFAFYCVVDYKLRNKLHVMTSRKFNEEGRSVSVVIDEEDIIEYETNRARMRYPIKRFPNIELLNRTPTPYGRKKRSVHFDTHGCTPNVYDNTGFESRNENLYSQLDDTPPPTVDQSVPDPAHGTKWGEDPIEVSSVSDENQTNESSANVGGAMDNHAHLTNQTNPMKKEFPSKSKQNKPRPVLLKSLSDRQFYEKRKSLRSTKSAGFIIYGDEDQAHTSKGVVYNHTVTPNSISSPLPKRKRSRDVVVESYDSTKEAWVANNRNKNQYKTIFNQLE